jgi:hypothetical protein
MSEAAQYLRRVKSEFESHGIRNETQMTEHVAFLLLPQVRARWKGIRTQRGVHVESLLRQIHGNLQSEYVGLRIPQPPPARQWGVEPLDGILFHLQNAFDVSPYNANWGAFFQREIRFELLKASSGSQYPTPHHVADLMAALALTGLNVADVFDPTAGSGGLLAACRAYPWAAGLTGCDFDPQWAGIGSAHLLLHDAKDASYHVDSALGYAKSYANHFNAVLMNPPFGGSRSAGEVAAMIGTRYGRSNATVLTALALHVLQPGGTMAVLVPSGVLFGGGGEAQLRADLLQQQLEAIISLPENAFQPYSQVAAHLLVARKDTPTDAVWFCALTHDGYPAGAGRDLTTDPNPAQNEFPRVRDLILRTRQNNWQTQLALDNVGELQTTLLDEAAALPAIGVRLLGDATTLQWEIVHLANGVLVKATDDTGQRLGWLYAPYTAEPVQAMSVAQAQAAAWTTIFPAEIWDDDLSPEWQISGADVSLTVIRGNTAGLTLRRSRTEFVFTDAGQQPGMACLVNEAGEPLTPWLRLTETRRQQDIIESQFGADYGAVAIEDAKGELAGWLLDVQTASAEDEESVEERAFLLIATDEPIDAYAVAGNGTTAVVLLERGWLRLLSTDTPQLVVETGEPVKLRSDSQVNGFAIGPAPANNSGADYSLFGVLVPRAEIAADDGTVGDLRPDRFLPEPEAAPPAHPLDVLARIRKGQTKLSSRVDSLLQTLGQTAGNGTAVATTADVPEWLVAMLSAEQREFWELLHRQQVNGRPRHFNVLDAVEWSQAAEFSYDEEGIRQQLQLLLRLGLVQAVHTQGHNLYRLVTVGDLAATR